MDNKKQEERTVTFDFNGTVTLKINEVFVDDDAPNKFTAEDVVALIEGQYSNIGKFIDDWGLGEQISCTIATSNDDIRDLII